MAQVAHHRPDGQGDEGRSGEMSCRRRQRLHRQTSGRGEAAVVDSSVDAQVVRSVPSKIVDIELNLLIDAIYQKYHYDFRGYAFASLKRRVGLATGRLGCESLSQLQHKVLHEPATFTALLNYLTVPVSEMFRDPEYFLALRQHVVPVLRTYPSLKVWIAGCSTGDEA